MYLNITTLNKVMMVNRNYYKKCFVCAVFSICHFFGVLTIRNILLCSETLSFRSLFVDKIAIKILEKSYHQRFPFYLNALNS